MGVMHAIWCSSPDSEAEALCAEMLGAITDRTSSLSACYFNRSALGEASAPWHALIEAIARGDVAGLKLPVDALIGLGHTSGQDALTGFLLATKALRKT
jgi:hypothetical protein